MGERGDQVVGRVEFAQQKDLARVVGAQTSAVTFQADEKVRSGIAEIRESRAKMVEINAAAVGRTMQLQRIEVVSRTSLGQLVARDYAKIRCIHKQLALRDAHRQQVVEIVERNRVPVAVPAHEAVDAAD